MKHPTLTTMYKYANAFSLDDVSIHRLYGYRLERYFFYDRLYNGDRTHFVDPHLLPGEVILSMVPERLQEESAFDHKARLDELVPQWSASATSRSVAGLRSSRIAYLCIGLQDSASWPRAAGSIAQVELLDVKGDYPLDPETVYVVQFGNGYRCSPCRRRGDHLILVPDAAHYTGPREFLWEKEARIVGRVLTLFRPELAQPPRIDDLPLSNDPADLVLSREWSDISDLFLAKYRRFTSHSDNRKDLRRKCEEDFGVDFKETTERRFRRPGPWRPHAHTGIYLGLRNYTPYEDVLHGFGLLRDEKNLYSMQEMLKAERWSDLEERRTIYVPPGPPESWRRLTGMYAEYPGLVVPQIFGTGLGFDRVWRCASETKLRSVPFMLREGAWVVTMRMVKDGRERNRVVGTVIPSSASYKQ